MTNTIFFETLRDDESCMSSCPSSRFSEVEELPRYSAFNEALLALKRKIRSSYRPPLPPQARRTGENGTIFDSSYTSPLPPQARRIGENEATNSEEEHVDSSTFVHPAPLDSNLIRFNLFELEAATMNFHPSNLLGNGGGSCSRPVFKGFLAATKLQMVSTVAVKLFPNCNQDNAEWLSEIKNLGTFDHPNLVKVVGYCLEKERRLLVSEFIRGTSLEYHFSSRSSGLLPFSWSLRMKIAIGIARGLAYLHEACPPNFHGTNFHGNIQPSNILLDSNYNVKLSDLGLVKNCPVYPMVEGIRGLLYGHGTSVYSAPESVRTGHLNLKSDIYSFGVVLLEIISGQRVIAMNWPSREHSLVEWARSCRTNKHQYIHLTDLHLEGQDSRKSAQNVANLVLRCLNMKANCRPYMDEVVRQLDKVDTGKHL